MVLLPTSALDFQYGDIDYDSVVALSDGFNGADLRNVCTEAGLFAIRENRGVCPAIVHEATLPSA